LANLIGKKPQRANLIIELLVQRRAFKSKYMVFLLEKNRRAKAMPKGVKISTL
jgi:hypothetical protein